jgi:hypothetical protein
LAVVLVRPERVVRLVGAEVLEEAITAARGKTEVLLLKVAPVAVPVEKQA